MLAPYARMGEQMDQKPDINIRNVAGTYYYNWLMWDWEPATGNVKSDDFLKYQALSYTVYAALSRIIPDEIFFKLADSNTAPFTLKSM